MMNKESIMIGKIIKSISGIYEVVSEGNIYKCKARGVFRKEGKIPLVGDIVEFKSDENENSEVITQIRERRNSLIRPMIANIDVLCIICSMCEPYPVTSIIDKLCAIAEYNDIEPIIVVTKSDIHIDSEEYSTEKFCNLYKNSGFMVFLIDYENEETINNLVVYLKGKISVFAGNSGVGKSTLLNAIDNELLIKTSEISKKLGRGRHTTTTVELYPLKDGGYIADTPGFSAMEVSKSTIIRKDDLQNCFRDLKPYIYDCKFTGCSHTCEKGCAVLKALSEGKIEKSRHQNYVLMYDEVKDIKDWEMK
jgi:ribosome biogenesis GTPase / thiamine phosphate phosphatase